MTYDEHEAWLQAQKDYEKELLKVYQKNKDLAVMAKEAVDAANMENGDLCVVQFDNVCVGKELDTSRYAYMERGRDRYKNIWVSFPRLLSKDEVAGLLDKGFKDLADATDRLYKEKEDIQAARKKELDDWKSMNKTIPINVWNALSDKQRKRIRRILRRTEIKLQKK